MAQLGDSSIKLLNTVYPLTPSSETCQLPHFCTVLYSNSCDWLSPLLGEAQKRPSPKPPSLVGCLAHGSLSVRSGLTPRVCASGYPGSWPRQSPGNCSLW